MILSNLISVLGFRYSFGERSEISFFPFNAITPPSPFPHFHTHIHIMSAKAQVKQNVCCIVIDGWGISPEENTRGDAIRNANTPYMDKFEKEYPFTTLGAHGLDVGLPDGLMGNSEVGHLNIGAGRVVYQV